MSEVTQTCHIKLFEKALQKKNSVYDSFKELLKRGLYHYWESQTEFLSFSWVSSFSIFTFCRCSFAACLALLSHRGMSLTTNNAWVLVGIAWFIRTTGEKEWGRERLRKEKQETALSGTMCGLKHSFLLFISSSDSDGSVQCKRASHSLLFWWLSPE